MYDVMKGVRVIEVAEHIFVPSAAMMLADWGADVIKVERAMDGGDPVRTMAVMQVPGQKLNGNFELSNRGKRSIGLDLNQAEGRDILYKLVESADIFITNLRANARIKLGIEPGDLMKHNPKLIYARGTGYGLRGAMAHHGGFDLPTAWCRSGSAFAQTLPDGVPPPQPGSVGDLMSGATLAGAVAAALFRRERTGKGGIVDNSLFHLGSYIMTQSVTLTSLGAPRGGPIPRTDAHFPLVNFYKTKDNRWLMMCLLMERWWPDFARHIGREDLLTDPRFAGVDGRMANKKELIAELDRTFATKTFEEWKAQLHTMEGVWAPCQNAQELLHDQQALDNGFITEVSMPDGDTYMTVASPGQFDEQPIGELRASPAFAQHTDEVMREIGVPSAQIKSLRTAGVLA